MYGVYPEIFKDMVKVVKAEKVITKYTGRKDKLIIEEQILITLSYWREYRTYFHIGQDWGINQSTVYRIICKIEDILIRSGLFSLPGKKTLIQPDVEIETIVVDVTEHQIERPQKKQKNYYSGKQKRHTIKSQIVVDLNTKLIVCIAYRKGNQHDFKIWKNSQTNSKKEITYLGDKGYQGIQKLHENSQIPIKKKRGQKLSKEQKKFNKILAKQRIIIEHINRYLKIFRLLSSRYRNRRKRLNLRLTLISGIYNYGVNSQGKLAIAVTVPHESEKRYKRIQTRCRRRISILWL